MKTIPCFVCKDPVELRDANAIAKLCSKCNTPANQEILKNTPIRQLLRNLDEGLYTKISVVESKFSEKINTVNEELNKLSNVIADLRLSLNTVAEQKPTEPVAEVKEGLIINEYGEVC